MALPSIVVTGASGRLGSLIVRSALRHGLDTAAVVRSAKAAEQVEALGVAPGKVHMVDATADDASANLAAAFAGRHVLIIATSAVAQVKALPTLVSVVAGYAWQAWAALTGASLEHKGPPFSLVASWKGGQTPEQVDWRGQVAQVDAAKAAGVRHVVLVSSAGGCDPHHFLNSIGGGDILNHKRRAEQYLAASGLDYAILHPNHLTDAPGGRRALVLGVDDTIQAPHWRQRMRMPRADLAELCVQAAMLQMEAGGPACRRSVDVCARAEGDGQPPATREDFRGLFESTPANCDYGINDRCAPGAVWACRRPGQAQ